MTPVHTVDPAAARDPLAIVWLATAARLGLRVVRSPEVFASHDGRGTLALGTPETLDPDDHLAQMVLHELCHWIVAGPDAVHAIDWGFDPTEELAWREWPTLRLQHALAGEHGLVDLLAPTTAGRAYWDRLEDPLVVLDDSPEEARIVEETRRALERARGGPWQPVLGEALRATSRIVGVVEAVSGEGVLVTEPP